MATMAGAAATVGVDTVMATAGVATVMAVVLCLSSSCSSCSLLSGQHGANGPIIGKKLINRFFLIFSF